MSEATGTNAPAPNSEEAVATRRLVYALAELDGDVVDPEDTPLMAAVGKAVTNVEDLVTQVENLQAQVGVLEDRAPDPSRQEYDQLDRTDKAQVVRSKLKSEANATNGRAKMEYTDVVRAFDGHPSAGHSYDIMETAAEGDGYTLGKGPDGTKRLTFDARSVNDSQ